MKLFYYKEKDGTPNFGDDLNPYIWNQLLNGVLDDNQEVSIVGIGTVIEDKLLNCIPNAKKIIVLGTGIGYGDLSNLPIIDDRWKIYFLRGPLSALVLNQPRNLSIADGAILIRRLYKPKMKKIYKFSFIPHVYTAKNSGKVWKKICRQNNVNYIDPRLGVEEVISLIDSTETIIAEAMHGAIVADALRVPWIPVFTTPSILGFKWWDWCLSLNMQYNPNFLFSAGEENKYRIDFKNFIKEKINGYILGTIIKNGMSFLSDEKIIEDRTSQIEEKIFFLKKDIEKGLFD
jgi:succinoglycan biosynthesis protein ExoV